MSQSFLEPLSFPRGATMPNRLALAAMTNCQSGDDGVLSDEELAWLVSRARGGYGIVSTCAAYVSDDGRGFPGQLGISDDRHVPRLRELAAAIQDHGALAFVQLFHAGVRAPSKITGEQPWSASEFELDVKRFEKPRAATVEDIEGVIDAFVAAAGRAAEAGFDGVEVHGAHGYLLSQFLGTITNTRTDDWGGSLENRARLTREIISRIRGSVPESFLVGVRVSPEVAEQGVDFDDSLEVAKWLVADGVDYLHVSNWDSFKGPEKYPDDERMLTQWFRDAVGPDAVIVATGGVWTAEQAETVMEHGADIIGLGRAAIGNPNWPREAVPGWQPVKPPFKAEALAASSVSPAFIKYLGRFRMVEKPAES